MNFPPGPVIAQPLAWFPFFNLPSTSTSFPDLPSVFFRDRSVPSCRPLRNASIFHVSSPHSIVCRSIDFVERTAQLLRGISDRFLMKYSRSATKSSFVSQHHFFVFLLLLFSPSPSTRARGPYTVGHCQPRGPFLSALRRRSFSYRHVSFLAMHFWVEDTFQIRSASLCQTFIFVFIFVFRFMPIYDFFRSEI